MSYLDDREAREKREREQARLSKQRNAQFRKDVQDALALPAVRRLLSGFFSDASVDRSAYRDRPTAMAYVAGWQDAARWWVDAIREHCPERETELRAEARRFSRP